MKIIYKGHTIEEGGGMLCSVWYHGPFANGGTHSVADAKRTIRRRLLQPTCPHPRERIGTIVGTKKRLVHCDRCDKLLRSEVPK